MYTQLFNINYIILLTIYTTYINNQTTEYLNNMHNNISPINNILQFQSKKNTSWIYNKQGKLRCKLITKNIQYFDNIKTIYMIQPTAILFNKNNIPTWNIQATRAEITHNKIMYLYQNVQIINLTKNTPLQSIKTNKAILNLMTYDILSNEKITIHGTFFQTTATNLQGNLNTKSIHLSNKVYTLYESKKILNAH